nr:hypothetical protein CFP56_56643 [Quercus suber]
MEENEGGGAAGGGAGGTGTETYSHIWWALASAAQLGWAISSFKRGHAPSPPSSSAPPTPPPFSSSMSPASTRWKTSWKWVQI